MSEIAIIVLLAAGLVAALMWRPGAKRPGPSRRDHSRAEPVGDGTTGTSTSTAGAYEAQQALQRRGGD